MYAFHATLHARPPHIEAGPNWTDQGHSYETLSIRADVLGSTTFACSFEEAATELGRLERMFCEPDGSFVWVSSHDETAWQLDGNLYDRNERLLFVDMRGTCPPQEFDRLLSSFGWPTTPIMFQLVRHAVLLDEKEFRRWALATFESRKRNTSASSPPHKRCP